MCSASGHKNKSNKKNGFSIVPRAGLDPLLFCFLMFFSRCVIFSCNVITQMFVVFFIAPFSRLDKTGDELEFKKRRNVV